MEIELKLTSSPLANGERIKYHFEVFNIDYTRNPQEKFSERKHDEFDYTKGYIKIQSQIEDLEKDTEYTNLLGVSESKNTLIHYATYTIDEIVNKIFSELHLREWEGKILKLPTGDYSKENLPPKEEIRKIIRQSMEEVGIKGDRLTETNKIKIESSFNTLLRKTGKTTFYERKAKKPFTISTQNMDKESLAVGNLRQNATVFYSSSYGKELETELREVLDAVIEDGTFPRNASKEINNFLLKTPLDLTLTNYEPERRFIERLCKTENAKNIDAWVKSRDVGFYPIEYSMTSSAGKHSKTQTFNPDFFIKVTQSKKTHFVVVEIKSDGDVSDENKAKLKYARQHFEDLNKELAEQSISQVYHFHFLSPKSYDVFFDALANGYLLKDKFRSDLEDKLEDDEQE